MRVLVFAPHRDDEVLGVGGTIAKYVKNGDEVFVCEVTDVQNNPELLGIIKSEEKAAHRILGIKESFSLEIPVVELPNFSVIERNRRFQQIVNEVKPNIAFLPHKGDMHKDHGVVAESALVALRPLDNPQLSAMYAYETLSETEWNAPYVDNVFIPNVWNDISDEINIKIEAMQCYKSQLCPDVQPRSIDTIKALARYRGSTIGVPYAESFMLIRQIMK